MLTALALTACDAGETPKPKSPAVSNAGGGGTVSIDDPLALLPADSDVVITLDIAALRKSALFAKYRGMLSSFILPGFADCTYDPLNDITTISAGVPMSSEMGVFVFRGLDRAKTLDCLRTSKVDTKTEVTFDGEYVMLRNKSGKENLLKFVDAKNAVMQGSTSPTKATLDKALSIGAPLRGNEALKQGQKLLQSGAVVSIVGVPGSPALSQMLAAKIGAPARGITTSIHFADVVRGHFVIEMLDVATAAAIVDNMRPQLDSWRMFVEHYDIKSTGPMVVIDIVITEAQIKTIGDMVKSMGVGAEQEP